MSDDHEPFLKCSYCKGGDHEKCIKIGMLVPTVRNPDLNKPGHFIACECDHDAPEE